MKRLIACLLFAPMLAVAAEPAKEIVCRACHGVGGAAPLMGLYPKLNGQNKDYLVSSIKAYKTGLRQGGMAWVMVSQSTGLSDAEINELAAYYASQP